MRSSYSLPDPLSLDSDVLAKRLRRKRECLHLTQAQVAKRAGVHRNTVSKVENNPSDVKFGLLCKIVHALDSKVVIPSAKKNHAHDGVHGAV